MQKHPLSLFVFSAYPASPAFSTGKAPLATIQEMKQFGIKNPFHPITFNDYQSILMCLSI